MILFLAFDGVLRRAVQDDPGRLNGQLIANLGGLLRRFGHLRVVLSTGWRLRQSHNDLLGWFHRDLHPRFIGRTPELGAGEREGRYGEILRWLERNGGLRQPWIAIDADRSRFPPDCRQLFLCEPERGLDTAAVSALREFMLSCMLEHINRRPDLQRVSS